MRGLNIIRLLFQGAATVQIRPLNPEFNGFLNSVNEGLLSRKNDSILALNSYFQGTITYSHARSHWFRLDPVCSPTPYLQRIPR